jgi:hypothetical protein
MFSDSSAEAINAATSRRRRRRPLWAFGILVVMAVIFLSLPTLIVQTGMLHHLMSRRLAKHDLEARIDSPQIGWFTPLQLEGIEVVDRRQLWRLSAKRLRGDRTLGQWLWKSSDLGTFILTEPTLLVELGHPIEAWQRDPPSPADAKVPRTQQFRIQVERGTILVQRPDGSLPETLVGQVDLDALWSTTPTTKTLTIEPGRPLQRVQLTPEMCELGLKYVAPIFASVAWTSGDLSLELDRCTVPLHEPAAVEVAGRVTLHAVETGLKNPLTERLAKLAATVTQRELPKQIRVADNSVIEFTVHEQRVAHAGLAFGLPTFSPELVIRTEGTVGFDKSLDLIAQIPVPSQVLGDRPLANLLGDQPLSLPITGTLEDPQIGAGDGQLVSELLQRVLQSETISQIDAADVVDTLKQLRDTIQQRREENGPLLPRRRQRWLRGER